MVTEKSGKEKPGKLFSGEVDPADQTNRKKIYKHFTDVMMETLKMKTLTEKDIGKRFAFTRESCELLGKYYQKKTKCCNSSGT